MHLLLLTREFPPHVVGGVAYHAYNLAQELAAEGHEITVLTAADGDRTVNGFDPPDGIDIISIDCPTTASPRLWFDRAVRRELTESDLLGSIDVIHSHEYVQFDKLPTDTPALLKVHFNIRRKLEFFPFDQYPRGVRLLLALVLRYGIMPLEYRLAKKSLRTADGRLFISDLTKRESERFGHADGASRVIHNGVDADRFTRTIDSSEDYFLFVGGTQTRKGYDTVMQTFHQTDSTLKIAGAERPPGTTAPENIEFLGYIEQRELPALYSNARALVHPALYEPFGNIVLESLACGTPVIVSNARHCGAAELLSETVSVTVDPERPGEFQDAVESFSPDNYSPEACRSLARQYGWQDVATETTVFASSLSQ
jgi:glycosyltransferase involved in cell wall biosynthesis